MPANETSEGPAATNSYSVARRLEGATILAPKMRHATTASRKLKTIVYGTLKESNREITMDVLTPANLKTHKTAGTRVKSSVWIPTR